MGLFDRLRHLAGRLTARRHGSTPEQLDLDQAYRAYGEGVRFIDVRDIRAWEAGRVAGAVYRPADELMRDPRIAVTRDSQVVIYCDNGERALRTTRKLRAYGYPRASALACGYDAWADAGYPVEIPGRNDNRG